METNPPYPVKVLVTLTADQACRIEAFRRRTSPIPSKREAIRMLIERGLDRSPTTP
jgi:hypothetical protein